MTGCLPYDSSHQPPQASYTLAAHSQGAPQSPGQSEDRQHQPGPGPGPDSRHHRPEPGSLLYPAHSRPEADFLIQQRPFQPESSYQQATVDPPCGYGRVQRQGRVEEPHNVPQPTQSEATAFLQHEVLRPDYVPQISQAPAPMYSTESQGQRYHSAHPPHSAHTPQVTYSQPLPQEALGRRPPSCQSFRGGIAQSHGPQAGYHHHRSPELQHSYRPPEASGGPHPSVAPRPAEWPFSGRQGGPAQSSYSGSSPHKACELPASSGMQPTGHHHHHPGPGHSQPPAVGKPGQSSDLQPAVVSSSVSPQAYHRPLLPGPPAMLDHSPVSPASSASPAHFIYPDHPFPSGHLASDPGASPYMFPVKQEASWRMSTPPRSSEMDSPPVLQQVQREGLVMHTSGSEAGDLADSETSSSVLEDNSSSSREQSPFSTMARNLSLHSPEHPPSPLAAKSPQPGREVPRGEDLEEGDDAHMSQESEFHPSKFKRRLHDRYMLSLKDTSDIPRRIKEESVDTYERSEADIEADSRRKVVPKLERADSPSFSETYVAHRSCSDTEMTYTESAEIGGTSADEGDVFMEPTVQERTKSKRLSLHQREPLDLSRAHPYSSLRSSSGSSPLPDVEHLSPASKLFSPFRSPHRLPYSPLGLMSPQSQSPLCSVPEGGRIFSFNMPSPLEGAHSDSDLVSPSPLSPRVFTFPPHGSLHGHPMSEVNRLALSPRAPFTPPPSFMRGGKPFSGGPHPGGPKWGEEVDFYSRRCLSESDMTYLCPMCGHVFASNDSLAKHIAKHLPSETVRQGDTKVHYCKVCNRSFSRSDMLTRHMRLHTGLKPYECYDCGQVFSRSDHLNTHRRTHTGEKPYHCPHCPYSACRRDMITRHMRTHTKRTSRRSRYLSVPDEGDSYKPSGSVSSTDRTDSQDFSVSGRTGSMSSTESEGCELIPSAQPQSSFPGASVDSLLSPEGERVCGGGPHHHHHPHPHPSPSCTKMAGGETDSGSSYDRFMQYRKGRNWSTTSVESVESEDAVIIREGLVDDAFLEPDSQLPRPGLSDRREGECTQAGLAPAAAPNPADVIVLEAHNLQKCFISPQPPGGNNSS